MKISEVLSNLKDLNNEFSRINKEIDQKKLLLSDLSEKSAVLVSKQNEQKQKILEAKTQNLNLISNQECLSNRNGAVRNKFQNLNEDLKQQADAISELKKLNLKNLGMKLDMSLIDEDSWEIKVHFVENTQYFIEFLYFNSTDDFELVSIRPAPMNFEGIKEMLTETGDFSGLLCYCRKYFIKLSKQSNFER